MSLVSGGSMAPGTVVARSGQRGALAHHEAQAPQVSIRLLPVHLVPALDAFVILPQIVRRDRDVIVNEGLAVNPVPDARSGHARGLANPVALLDVLRIDPEECSAGINEKRRAKPVSKTRTDAVELRPLTYTLLADRREDVQERVK